MEPRYVYRFGSKVADADGSMRTLLGNKGAGLVQMSDLAIPDDSLRKTDRRT